MGQSTFGQKLEQSRPGCEFKSCGFCGAGPADEALSWRLPWVPSPHGPEAGIPVPPPGHSLCTWASSIPTCSATHVLDVSVRTRHRQTETLLLFFAGLDVLGSFSCLLVWARTSSTIFHRNDKLLEGRLPAFHQALN